MTLVVLLRLCEQIMLVLRPVSATAIARFPEKWSSTKVQAAIRFLWAKSVSPDKSWKCTGAKQVADNRLYCQEPDYYLDGLNIQVCCRLPKWKSKTRHGVSFVPSLLKILEKDLKQQAVYQDSPKDAPSNLSLKIEMVITFSPNQDPQDISQQLQLGEFMHYHPFE
ncbi:hypothetical protein TNCV_1788871 [Trichonephila clavipes]|nr:hypothetical protein TNCV_1788871 [Trichonephila clavipes]